MIYIYIYIVSLNFPPGFLWFSIFLHSFSINFLPKKPRHHWWRRLGSTLPSLWPWSTPCGPARCPFRRRAAAVGSTSGPSLRHLGFPWLFLGDLDGKKHGKNHRHVWPKVTTHTKNSWKIVSFHNCLFMFILLLKGVYYFVDFWWSYMGIQ